MKKKNIIMLFIIIIISGISIYVVNNNYNLYNTDILKITEVKKVKKSTLTNQLGFRETYYNETIIGILKNNKNKGKKITLKNTSTTSNVITESYKKNDEVFIKDNSIIGLKRDKYIVLMILIFIISIYLVGTYKGLYSVISVVVNIVIFMLGLTCYLKGTNLIILILLESILFTVFSLTISNGFTKKTQSAILSVFISTIVLTTLILLITQITKYKGVNFNGMNFLTVPPEEVFTAEILIGGLGAIMDVAITISASFSELISKNKNIKNKDLISSGNEIGKDVMGTMINVLFFTYLCGGLPVFVLALRNGFTLTNYISSNYSLELTRFLTGSIGIVLTIPISIFVCLKTFRKETI